MNTMVKICTEEGLKFNIKERVWIFLNCTIPKPLFQTMAQKQLTSKDVQKQNLHKAIQEVMNDFNNLFLILIT